MNRQLHGERIVRGTHRRRWHPFAWENLPEGTFTLINNTEPVLVLAETVVPWTSSGYGRARTRPTNGSVEVITPPSTVAALRAGYRPQIDPGATAAPPAL